MKQTMLLKLVPTKDQYQALLEVMRMFNKAANYVASVAFAEKTANKFALQKVVYGELRTTYKLPSQLAIRCISKVSEAYKRDKSIQPTFRPEGAIIYDQRVMSFKGLTHVSLLTLAGRVLVPFLIGSYQASRMGSIKGQADLMYRKGTFYLAVTLEVPEPLPFETSEVLGIDLGIVNLATDSTGESFSGELVEKNRKRHHALRQRLQRRGTKSAKRHLKKLSGKQARFQKHTNHAISKRMVQKARANGQALALEELRHIRSRTERTVQHSRRAKQSNWSFWQLRFFLSYKAVLAGVPSHLVDPAYASRTCSACGHCAKENHKSQAHFCCMNCSMSMSADWNAAINISRAEPVKQPIVAGRA